MPARREPRDSTRSLLWVALAMGGLSFVVALKLAVLHVAVHEDPSTQSFCAISESVNCDTVARSPHSVFLGVPVAVWGMVGALGYLGVAFWGIVSRRRSAVIGAWLVVSGVGVSVSVLLGAVSMYAVESLCILCLATYLLCLGQLALALVGWRKLAGERPVRSFATLVARDARPWAVGATVPAAVFVALIAFYPKYWDAKTTGSQEAAPSGAQQVRAAATSPPVGHDSKGRPCLGSDEAELTIVEYSDYECPFCRRAHFELRRELARRGDVRLVHAHFPLDEACNRLLERPFHRRACAAAKLAICAEAQGKFWEANDYLFSSAHDSGAWDPQALASALGLDAARLEHCLSSAADETLARDIEDGIRLGIGGTPSYVVGDRVYVGRLPAELLSSAHDSRGAHRG